MAEAEEAWLPVIGRALAYLCLKAEAGDEGRSVQQKARFLEALGVTRGDVAEMLGTTAASITELHRQAKAKKSKDVRRGVAKKKSGREQ